MAQLALTWGLIWIILRATFHIAPVNIVAFWVLPLVLSSLQLFIFGTYLPHRPTRQEEPNRHRATSSNYPVLYSFLTCYHFGYHWDHHEYSQVPWYHLPKVREQK